MACSPSTLLANQLNSRKSTGPKTPAGKRRAAMNSVSHGIYCSHAVVQGEDQEQFDALRETFLLEFAPQDLRELLIVDRIVMNNWKLRRLQKSEFVFYLREIEGVKRVFRERCEDPMTTETVADMTEAAEIMGAGPYFSGIVQSRDLAEAHSRTERFGRMEQRLENCILRLIRELTKLRKQRGTDEDKLPLSPYIDPRTTAEADKMKAEKLKELARENGWDDDDEDRDQPNSDTPTTGETPVSRECDESPDEDATSNMQNEPADDVDTEAEEPSSVTRASRPCSMRADDENGGIVTSFDPPITDETPVSQMHTSMKMQNEAIADAIGGASERAVV